MAVDVATVLVSTVAGGAGGVIFASLKTNREETAKRRALAKDRVREAVADQLAEVVAYQAGFGDGRADKGAMWISDYMFASKVVLASPGVGWARKKLVERRLARLVGPVASGLAIAKPAPEADKGVMGAAITAEIQAHRSGRYPDGVPKGLIEIALRKKPDSVEIKKLKRQLTRLAASR